jgi:hypothetical protein
LLSKRKKPASGGLFCFGQKFRQLLVSRHGARRFVC